MDYFNFFNHVPENIVIVSPEYKILAATDAYLKVTMRTREEIVGMHFLKEAFPEKGVPYEENPVKLALDKTLASKETLVMDVIRYDLSIPEEEGGGYKELYWETSYYAGLDAQGQVQYLIQKAVNVTERELAKKAQKESEEKFKFLTDAVPQMIHTAEPQGAVNFVNQRWLEYTGLSMADFVGNNWHKVMHPEDLSSLVEHQKESIQTGEEFQAEVRIKSKEGHYRWHLLRSMPMKDAHGQVIMRVGSTYDIHSTKQMVQELLATNEQMSALSDQVQQAYQRAEDQRMTLERLIMQAPAIFAIVQGPDHRFELVNPYYQKLFPGRELVGKTLAEAVPEVVEQGFIQILDNVFHTGEPFIAEEIGVTLDWHNTGTPEEAFFTTTYQPLIENEKVTGIIAFGYEVTEKVKLRKELEQLRSAASTL